MHTAVTLSAGRVYSMCCRLTVRIPHPLLQRLPDIELSMFMFCQRKEKKDNNIQLNQCKLH